MGDFNLKTEHLEEKTKLEDLFPQHNLFVYGATFRKLEYTSSLDHIFVEKKYSKTFKTTIYQNIYSDHATVNIRYSIIFGKSI